MEVQIWASNHSDYAIIGIYISRQVNEGASFDRGLRMSSISWVWTRFFIISIFAVVETADNSMVVDCVSDELDKIDTRLFK